MSKTVAIIGASANRNKFGNKAVRAYRDKGWTVYPVNPTAHDIEGLKVYPSIADVPAPVHRVSMYVPPATGTAMLDAIAAKSPGEVFLNPGSESDELIAAARKLGLPLIIACSIEEIGLRPGAYRDE